MLFFTIAGSNIQFWSGFWLSGCRALGVLGFCGFRAVAVFIFLLDGEA